MDSTTKIMTASLLTAAFMGTSLALANEAPTPPQSDQIKTFSQKKGPGKFGGTMKTRFLDRLSDTEKTALESMSDEEKKTFFEKKRSEFQAKREARETVIDKLLAGQSLTSQEELLRKEIISQRAERKVKMQERKQNMEVLRTLLEKKRSGESLSADETTKLEEFQSQRKHRHTSHHPRHW